MTSIKWNILLFALLFLFACEKENEDELIKTKNYKNGYLVLCEGLFNQNNSSLDWIKAGSSEAEKNIFETINGRPLGDVANHMIQHGGKIYIAVTTSSTVEVIDGQTLRSLRQISFNYDNKIQQPRRLVAHGDKVYASSFDGYVSAIDTANLKVVKRIKVGRNPDGLCSVDNALFVSNSGGLDPNNPDSTVMRIALDSWTVTDTFNVGKNPGDLMADDNGNVFVVKRGDYNQAPSELVRIDPLNKTVENLQIPATTLAKRDHLLYLSFYDFSNGNASISSFNTNTQSVDEANYLSTNEIHTLYGVVPNKNDGIICLDAMNYVNTGYLRFFNANKQLKQSINVSLNPNTIIFK